MSLARFVDERDFAGTGVHVALRSPPFGITRRPHGVASRECRRAGARTVSPSPAIRCRLRAGRPRSPRCGVGSGAHQERLQAAGLPAQFLASLQAAANELVALIGERAEELQRRVAATKGVESSASRGLASGRPVTSPETPVAGERHSCSDIP